MAINQLEVLKHNLITQNEQGKALVEMIEKVEGIESNVINVRDEVVELKNDVKKDLNDMRNRITIDYESQKELQSIVKKKSNKIAKEHYGEPEEYGAEIRELSGYATRFLWSALKDKYRITRFTSLRQVDFKEGKDFLKNVVLGKDFINSYEQWKYQRAKKRQRELKQLNGDTK